MIGMPSFLRSNFKFSEDAPAHQGKRRLLPSEPPSFALCEGGSEESKLSCISNSILWGESEGADDPA